MINTFFTPELHAAKALCLSLFASSPLHFSILNERKRWYFRTFELSMSKNADTFALLSSRWAKTLIHSHFLVRRHRRHRRHASELPSQGSASHYTNDTMLWYYVLILCSDAMLWYHVLILCYDNLFWCYVLILCYDNLFWCYVVILMRCCCVTMLW